MACMGRDHRSLEPQAMEGPLRSEGSTVSGNVDPAGKLCTFRVQVHSCMKRRSDALFELADAILTAGSVPSPVHLSLAPVHRRGWCSLYAALSQGHIDAESVRDLLAEQPFDDGLAVESPAVYAVDMSSWPRCDAESSPERGYYYHPSRHSAGQPIIAGWA